MAPVWRLLGDYVAFDKAFYDLFKQEVVAAHIFFLLAFLEEPFIINMLY